MAGNPNPKGSKPDKLMRDAIMVALNREAKDAAGQPTKKLYQIAERLVDQAIEGDMQAIKEVNDRIDGKAPQAMTLAGDDEGGPMRFEQAIRTIVDPKA